MKATRNISFFISLAAVLILMSGCNKEETRTGTIDFGMEAVEESLKSLSNQNEVVAALVTVADQNGQLVYEKEYLEFYSFGESFVTKHLQLEVGRYTLEEFMLIDSTGTIIWATPKEGSRLAYLVDDPLPIKFAIYPEETTHLFPQVVRIGTYSPEDFGYAVFNVEFIEQVMCLGIWFESDCETWYGGEGDSIRPMGPDGVEAPIFPSILHVFAENSMGMLYKEYYLTPGYNRILIPRDYNEYKFTVTNCRNEVCYENSFSIDQLRVYTCAYGKLLRINCSNNPDIIITPEGLIEPTIEQGLFGSITGSVPYADSVFIVEDSTVIWTDPCPDNTDYCIFPLVADLYLYDITYDTIYYPVFTDDCYVYPDIYREPTAIVRSNSDGYYQVPLAVGKYMYMVQTPYGFYIDCWVSSHLPGEVKVYEGQVTILNIHVTPCYWLINDPGWDGNIEPVPVGVTESGDAGNKEGN